MSEKRYHVKISESVKRTLIDIWKYTNREWGESQADAYLYGLHETLTALSTDSPQYREVPHPELRGIYMFRYQHHFVFFRELSTTTRGVIAILHESMDLPNRLKDEIED